MSPLQLLPRIGMVLVLGWLSLLVVASEIDCTYDQPHQVAVLREIASRHPGAAVSDATGTVSWTNEAKTEMSVQFGGCHHLGFTVSATRARDIASPEGETFRVAVELAKGYWDNADSNALESATTSRSFTKETTSTGVLYYMEHDSYDEFVVERELLEGHERITIRWLRSY